MGDTRSRAIVPVLQVCPRRWVRIAKPHRFFRDRKAAFSREVADICVRMNTSVAALAGIG
jgi:hypothetical protein